MKAKFVRWSGAGATSLGTASARFAVTPGMPSSEMPTLPVCRPAATATTVTRTELVSPGAVR